MKAVYVHLIIRIVSTYVLKLSTEDLNYVFKVHTHHVPYGVGEKKKHVRTVAMTSCG